MLTRSQRAWIAPWMSDPFFGHPFRQMSRVLADLEHFPEPAVAAPRFELKDAEDALRVRAELPGFGKDDLDVQLERETLTIRGKRDTKTPEGYAVHRRERSAVEFARSFDLPCRVDADRATATLENGVFELTLPKIAEERPRHIEVKVQ